MTKPIAAVAEPVVQPASEEKAGLLQTMRTPADIAAYLDDQVRSLAEHLHLTTVGILYAVLRDKGVLFDERRDAHGAFALYLRPTGADPAATERLLEQLMADAHGSGGRMARLAGWTMNAAGRLLERLPGAAEKLADRMRELVPDAQALRMAYLLKRLAATPFLVADEGGTRLALPADIGNRKQLDELCARYEIGLRALPEYQSYCELLVGILCGILDGVQPGHEQMAAAGALLTDMLTAPSKLAFLNRLTADLALAGRFNGRSTISVLAVGAGGFEFLSAIVAAAPREARIQYQVVSGWQQVAKGVTELGRERFPGVAFVSYVPMVPGALAERLDKDGFDVIILNLQDPCAQEAAALLGGVSGDARDSLVFMTQPCETQGLELILGLTGMWPQVLREPAMPDGDILGAALAGAGYRRQVVIDPVLTVFSREAAALDAGAAPRHDEAKLAGIRDFISATFSAALEDGGTIEPQQDLAELGLSSMTWALLYTRLQQRFGTVVEPGLFTAAGPVVSVESLTAVLADKLAGATRAAVPVPDALADLVAQRLLALNQAEVPLPHAAQLTRARFTSSRGQVFEYFERGSGPAVIFLSALAFEKSIWEDQIGEFSGDYRLIFPHMPGHGGSTHAGDSFTFEDLADDLVELMDALDVGAAHLVGWCVTGNIAQLLALRHPKRLASLTLVCTTPTDARMRGITHQALEDYSVSPLLTYQMEFNNIYHEDFLAPEVARSLAIIRQTHVPVEPQALLSFISSLFGFDTRQRLPDIQVPTLIVAGNQDIAFPVDQVALLKEGIRDARLVVFEKGGHLPFLNQSREFNAALRKFLSETNANRSPVKGREKAGEAL